MIKSALRSLFHMANLRTSLKNPKVAMLKLIDYCRANDWKGYDPYDALNSRVFKYLPFLDFRLPRLLFTQILKRIPFNIRPLLMVPKTQNPKAIALFLMSFIKLSRLLLLEQQNLIGMMVEKLVALRAPNSDYWSWGYSFPWQGRTILVPREEPNLVCTCFIASALFDAYEKLEDSQLLKMALSSTEYILNDLYWEKDDSVAGFSYPLPGLQSRTHNANFLGAAILCRAYKLTGDKKFLIPAFKVVRYSTTQQKDDGSWAYAESSNYRWIDNFHTGYNLCALWTIGHCGETNEFEIPMRRGFEFYKSHFIREDGAPRYFHNRTYPIDIHSVAQSIITLLVFKDFDDSNVDLALAVFKWAMDHMWDKKGYFHYQIQPHYKNKIPYMRWSQAWMLLALSTLLEHRS